YRILGRRVRTPYGEIDLVAVRGRRLAFVEVKRRATRLEAEAAITSRQAGRIARAAEFWVSRNGAYCEHEQGLDVVFVTPRRLPGGRLIAHGFTLAIEDKVGGHYRLSEPRTEDLSDWDVVLLRQDPPFDMSYITTTHLLERIHPKTLVVNDPSNVRNAPEKVFVLDFLDLMPPTLVTRNLDDVKRFRAEHKDI